LDRTKSEDYKSVFVSFLIAMALLLPLLGFPALKSSDLMILAALVLPPLFGYAVASGGYAVGALAMALCFVSGYALDSRLAVILAAVCVPFAFVSGYVIRKQVRFRHSVMATSAAALTGILLGVGALWLITKQLPIDFFASQLNSSFSALTDADVSGIYQLLRTPDLVTGAITQSALDATSRADAIVYLVNLFKEQLNYRLVGLIGSYALLLGLVGYVIPRALRKRFGTHVIAIPPFSDFKLPERFWLAFFLSYLFSVIGEGFGWSNFAILEVTVLSIYGLVLSVQGLSFLDFLYKRRKMGKAARIVLHVAAFILSSLLGNLLMWVGLLDNMASLRTRLDTKGGTVS
jgi:hypothetical protein